ncbi:MAG: RHS repeat-associated core domain-containing protein [Planctomycetes bacterium]|nr:RHS repeat-associated core domain-containing protein [Planctomycetota bacterium]
MSFTSNRGETSHLVELRDAGFGSQNISTDVVGVLWFQRLVPYRPQALVDTVHDRRSVDPDDWNTAVTEISYDYDEYGNTIEKSTVYNNDYGNSDKMEMRYDELDRIENIKLDKTELGFQYDTNGQRIRKVVTETSNLESVTEDRLYIDNLLVIKNIFSNTERVTKNISDGNGVIATKINNQNGRTIFYSTNHIGSTTMLTDIYGKKISEYQYTPYGELWYSKFMATDINNVGDEIDRLYTNQIYDKETGLYYYNARYYDPQTGHFLRPDPAMEGFNHYLYVGGNPINYIDPTGMEMVTIDGKEYEILPEYETVVHGKRTPEPVVDRESNIPELYYSPETGFNTGNLEPDYPLLDEQSDKKLGSVGSFLYGLRMYAPSHFNGIPSTTIYRGNNPALRMYSKINADAPGAVDQMTMDLVDVSLNILEIEMGLLTFAIGAVIKSRLRSTIRGLTISQLKTVLKSSRELYKGSTLIGHSLSKHAGRKPEIWGRIAGAQKTWHGQAMKHFREIFRAPGDFQRVTNSKGTTFLEKMLPDGRGVRLQLDYVFKGFID